MDTNSNEPVVETKGKMHPYHGEVVYIYAFDLAYDMKRQAIPRILSQPVTEYSIEPDKRSPKRLFFYRPQMVALPAEKRGGPHGPVEIRQTVKLFDVGAISIKVHVPFEVDHIEDLVAYHDLKFADASLADQVKELAEKARLELEPYCIHPVGSLSHGEGYTVFCINELPKSIGGMTIRAEDWLMTNRRQVAGLLTQEQDAAALSEQEAEESTGQYLSYYDSDLVVVDWDAALVVGEQDAKDDVLHIMELANVQLVELAAYDQILDGSLEAAYRDVARTRAHASREMQRNLREIRVDMARLSDELLNITKFFGDWHLANIYKNLAGRFHLADWHHTIDEKLAALGDLYAILQQDWVNFWMVILETTIVLLFIIDLILLLTGPIR
jgi:hypothetical protein